MVFLTRLPTSEDISRANPLGHYPIFSEWQGVERGRYLSLQEATLVRDMEYGVGPCTPLSALLVCLSKCCAFPTIPVSLQRNAKENHTSLCSLRRLEINICLYASISRIAKKSQCERSFGDTKKAFLCCSALALEAKNILASLADPYRPLLTRDGSGG